MTEEPRDIPRVSLELPVFNEAAELFGEPPTDDISDRLAGIFGLVTEKSDENTPSEVLAVASILAASAQGDAYTNVLDATMKTALDLRATGHAQLRDLFHRAARYGEARMLSNIIADLFNRYETAGAPPIDRRN